MLVRTATNEVDYKDVHGHDKVETGSIAWHFHNYEHGYRHCTGGAANPYELKHKGALHYISKEYARGHGKAYNPVWFHFTTKVEDGWWDVSSGKEIPVADVPDSFK